MKALMILCFGLLSTTLVYAKEVVGYRFEDYPATIYQGKKAPLKLGSKYQPLKNHLTDAHKDGEIGFAGKYMVSIWGCGTGCISGAMIDKRTGKIYDFPVNIDYRCYSSEETPDDEDIFFYPDSRLLITTSCEQDEDTDGYAKQTFTYFISVWNEKSKTFKSIDKVKRTKTVKID